MKSIAKIKSEPGLNIVDVPQPRPAPNEALIKIKAASICGSDVHLFKWDYWAQKHLTIPRIIGHECAGEIVEVGKKVTSLKVGDHIAIEGHVPCLKCARCKNDEMHLCTNIKNIGFTVDGGFAEYMVAPEICCVKLNKNIPWKVATIHDPLGNAVYTVDESNVTGKTVVIFGDGPTGLFAAAVARCYKAAKIFSVGISPYRMEILKKMRPDRILHAIKDNVIEIMMDETKGEGADVVIEMSGAAPAINQAFSVVRKGGTFTAFGIPGLPLEIDLAKEVILKGVKIIGIHGRKMFDTWKKMAKLFDDKTFDVSPVITHEIPMEKIDYAMEILTASEIEAGKILLQPFN